MLGKLQLDTLTWMVRIFRFEFGYFIYCFTQSINILLLIWFMCVCVCSVFGRTFNQKKEKIRFVCSLRNFIYTHRPQSVYLLYTCTLVLCVTFAHSCSLLFTLVIRLLMFASILKMTKAIQFVSKFNSIWIYIYCSMSELLFRKRYSSPHNTPLLIWILKEWTQNNI